MNRPRKDRGATELLRRGLIPHLGASEWLSGLIGQREQRERDQRGKRALLPAAAAARPD